MMAGNTDVNLDYQTTAADALYVINHMGRYEDVAPAAPKYQRQPDVNGDNKVTAIDALLVINAIPKYAAIPKVYSFSVANDVSTYGLTRENIDWAISNAIHEVELVGNVDLRPVAPPHGRWHIASRELYIGNWQHARGQTLDGIGGKQLRFHNGHVSERNTQKDYSFWWTAFASAQGLKQVVQHELGHGMGFGHTSNTSCVMHINASTDQWCSHERNTFIRWWGPSTL